MPNNVYQHKYFAKKKLELSVRDTQDNLEEFMHVMAENCDLDTFDILSITRTDENSQYTQNLKYPRVATQDARVAYDCAEIIPLPRRHRR